MMPCERIKIMRKRWRMPIKDVSNARRVPRLGKIRLGIMEKGGKSPYPKQTDYFVVPDEIKEFVGEEPRELQIMFPADDVEKIAPQWLRCYGQTHSLVCWGDGEKAKRKIDVDTGAIAGRDTKYWEWKPITCLYEECEEWKSRCKPVMNLMFLMPQVPGLGVWQIDTSGFHSIREINSSFELIMQVAGRISGLPLTLQLVPMEVNPQGTSKQTRWKLRLSTNFKLAEVLKHAQLPAGRLILEEPEVEEAPDDLFPPETLEGGPFPLPPEEPEEPEEPYLQVESERIDEWQAIRQLMLDVKVKSATARSYYAKVHDVAVPVAVFDEEQPPPELSLGMLTAFRETLETSKMKLA